MASAVRSARIAGVLLISATTAALVGSALVDPATGDADVLAAVDAAQGRVLWGAAFAVVAALCSASIAIAFYPVLRPHTPGLAIGSVALRAIEAALYLVGALGPMLLVVLSRQVDLATATPADRTSAELLASLQDQAGILGALAAYVGASLYYFAFHLTRLLPAWLADWGLLGVGLALVAGVLVLLGVTSFGSPLMVVMNLPFAVQEIVMAVWLLVRGFAVRTD